MNVQLVNGTDVRVSLSRRNLLALLAKLDEHPPNSKAELQRIDGDLFLSVKAEEDVVHYGDRKPGRMHPATEAEIQKRSV